MVYMDNDYKIECEHKISYDKLVKVSASDLASFKSTYSSNIVELYSDTTGNYIAKTSGEYLEIIWLVEGCVAYKIGEKLYKIYIPLSNA